MKKATILTIVISTVVCVAIAFFANHFLKAKNGTAPSIEPTPDYSLIAPTPTLLPENSEDKETEPSETELPLVAATVKPGLDLWLDATSTISEGTEITDEDVERLTGVWYGGFFYGWRTKDKKTGTKDNTGWLPIFLNTAVNIVGSEQVRLLRLAQETIQSDTFDSLVWNTAGRTINFPDILNAVNEDGTSEYRLGAKKAANFTSLGRLEKGNMPIQPFSFYRSTQTAENQEDVLLYALQHLDNRKVNMIVVDTLSMKKIDSTAYQTAIENHVADTNGDFRIVAWGVQLDYAGRINGIYGNSFDQTLYWGFTKFTNSISGATESGLALQRMPRSLLVLMVGPKQETKKFSDELNNVLTNQKTDESIFPVSKAQYNAEIVTYRGKRLSAPTFSFDYCIGDMQAVDIDQEIRNVINTESASFVPEFYTEDEKIETESYVYQPDITEETNVPIVESAFIKDLEIHIPLSALLLQTQGEQSFVYPVTMKLVKGCLTQKMTLEEMIKTTDKQNKDDPVYLGSDGNIYCFHPMEQENLAQQWTLSYDDKAVVENEEVVLTLQKCNGALPEEGYYWIECSIEVALSDEGLEKYNVIEWAAASEAESEITSDSLVPAKGESWDYSPEAETSGNFTWKTYLSYLNRADELDIKTLSEKMEIKNLSYTVSNRSKYQTTTHHALGLSSEEDTIGSGNNIPPIFKIFQLNSIYTAIRSGLIYHGLGTEQNQLTFSFIIHMPASAVQE